MHLSGETGDLRSIQGLTAKAYQKHTNAIEGRSQYAQRYHLNKLGGGGFAGGFAARKTPIFPHLLKRYAQKMGAGIWKGQPPVKVRRYRVEAQTQGSNIWEPICYTDDLCKAKGSAAAMLRSEEIRAMRVVDQETGQVWIIKTVLHNPAGSEL